jgi:putative phosphoesterase
MKRSDVKILIAVFSDTHDHRDNILKAVSIVNEKKVDALIHCGDYVAPFVKKWFNELNDSIKKQFFGVFGNNDGEILYLTQNLGQICKFAKNGNELIIELGGKKIFASHMPKKETIDALVDSGKFNIILTGHTHNMDNRKQNGVLIVNPGELCGYLTNKSTFAIIDTDTMSAEIIEI